MGCIPVDRGNTDMGAMRASMKTLREGGVLSDLVPTMLEIMQIEQPKEMTGKSLIVK